MVSGSWIKLLPGFHVTAGSKFSAKIDEYDCYSIGKKEQDFTDNNYIPAEISDHIGAKYTQTVSNSYMKTKNIEEMNLIKQEYPISVYPNPAKNIIHVSFIDFAVDYGLIVIRNLNGETVSCYDEYFSDEPIDISSLFTGVYVLEIKINNQIFKEKIVVL